MTVSPEEVGWDLYPHVAIHPHAKAFIQWLVLNARRPKTIDAYARAIDHLENFSDSLALLSVPSQSVPASGKVHRDHLIAAAASLRKNHISIQITMLL